MTSTRVVIALGGNAMTGPDGSATPEAQRDAIRQAAGHVAEVVAAGVQVVLTHGNGPQVGNLLVKNELAAHEVPPVPLDWNVAQTQATIGFTVADELDAALAARRLPQRTAALVTRTLVDGDDPHFAEPSKPVGRFLPRERAERFISLGQTWEDRGEKGWRRVVASPEPLSVVDSAAIHALAAAGFVVVCAGGGGIPVVDDRVDGHALRGVEAVIDKDLTAAILARDVDAGTLVIATDVPNVMVGFGTPAQRPLGRVTVAELRELAAAGEFARGSMGPKVEAALRFVEAGGARSVITSLDHIADAVRGDDAGTVVTTT
ncbi:carbamate kinase [Blastococcus sp. MG754426]|uniref:carbamate kinase n=1 Tax=unclassified Blastococcus TaxID=2619396 RepID=UPI001EF12688|nr:MULTISPECIES: carbamate kinase [unclassified Blastococcus]MCF6507935.1 carbamate kinase [Blastococcus sp. MG754426]MCF6512517.1 carbamate kinase [Blastococcus sp. MG754427]MCF6736616.1 carbamate kinase [Blastococcus sp. KM273129]